MATHSSTLIFFIFFYLFIIFIFLNIGFAIHQHESHSQRTWQAIVHRVSKSRT